MKITIDCPTARQATDRHADVNPRGTTYGDLGTAEELGISPPPSPPAKGPKGEGK